MQASPDTTNLDLSDIQGNLAGFSKPMQRFIGRRFEPAEKARASISGLKQLAGQG